MVPAAGGEGQKATFALASAAYRDDPVEKILDADNEWHRSKVNPGKSWARIFRPNLGEAFSRAVIDRLADPGRKPVVQSFGMDPQTVVVHCLAANGLRRTRDLRLTAVMLLCGVVFLPGLLAWLLVFTIRATLAKAENRRTSGMGTLLLAAFGLLAVVFFVQMPFGGIWAWYSRGAVIAPVIGWIVAKRICESTARDLRDRWASLLSGSSIGAKVPEAVPSNPDESAERLRQSLNRLGAEQQSNVVFYAGPKGILGMGTRWGSWQMAEDLVPAEEGKEIYAFRSWDVVRAIHAKLSLMERTPVPTEGIPKPSVEHWIVSPVPEGADSVARPEGADVDAFRYKPHAIQQICNRQQFGSGDRHYLGVQWVLWEGQLVLTMLVTVTVLYQTLRIEVTGHALGPVHGLFNSKPAAKEKSVEKAFKPWEKRTVALPLVDPDEVVRLAARAPLTWFHKPLNWLGGSLTLPEPFGLRHSWAEQPWRHRFMADDAMRVATPVLRAVHQAVIGLLDEHGVATDKFGARSSAVSGAVQDPTPRKADTYDA
ncbi:hypothetical protein [Streptomyces sp. NPDC005012]|uniref:hypothetical protein n=1 Tax=unclassified Streptomyces TaxID=2593676 RepID=UPI0033A67270